MSLFEELKRRKVFRAAAAYAIFAWLVVQIVVTIEEPLALPGWFDTLSIALLAAGFPVALLLSWVFDLTSDGPVKAPDDDTSVLQKSTVLTVGLLFIVSFLIGVHRLATGQWIFSNQAPGLQLERFVLVSNSPGSHTQPAFSPDGSMVAFVNDATGLPQIWVKTLHRGDPVQLTYGQAGAFAPVWSPGNDSILFHRSDGSLWSVGPLGTPEPRKILDDGIYPSISPNGEFIVYESGRDVFLAKIDGSEARRLENVPPRFFSSIHYRPAYSPDGRSLAVFVQQNGPNGDYWIVPLDGGDARRLTHDMTQGGAPAWSADGQYIVFPSRRGGTQTLWAQSLQGGEPRPVTAGVGEDSEPAISRDGKRLVYSNARVTYTIMLSDPETGKHREIYTSRNSIYLPQPSPDGSHFTFFTEQSNGVQVMLIEAEGTRVTALTQRPGELNIHPSFSADGNHVYFYRDFPERALRKISIEGGPSVEVFPGFSWQTHMRVIEDPGGRYIAYTRMEPPDWSKDRNVVKDLQTGEERIVAAPHMHSSVWSQDGQWLLGYRHGGEMAICPASGEECRIIEHDGEIVRGGQPRWSSDESRIFFRRPAADNENREVWVVNSDGSGAARVLEYGPLQPLNQPFEVTPDDKILWVRYERGDDEIWAADIL